MDMLLVLDVLIVHLVRFYSNVWVPAGDTCTLRVHSTMKHCAAGSTMVQHAIKGNMGYITMQEQRLL